jgi:hypothetical protein
MNSFVPIALFGWPLVSLLLFAWLKPRRAILASVILAWLFLPVAALKMPGLPAYNKNMATALAALLGVLLFDFRRLLSFRPGWKDLPMAVWCLSPLFSSLTNDLGVHDGSTAVIHQVAVWGLPYLFGRIYCSTLVGMAELALAIFLGGLVYVPFCLFEIRMSPQLHIWIYGYHQHSFAQAMRGGGFRPTVFMEHGLMVSMWMASASLLGIWLWVSGTLRTLFRVPLPWYLLLLVGTLAMSRSMGALVLTLLGVGVLLTTKYASSRALVFVLALLPLVYLGLRIPKIWSGSQLTEAALMVSPERAQSLNFRLVNEDRLVERAFLRPAFGWGGWGRAHVNDDSGRDISVTDSLWIIVIGNYGLVGLLAVVGVFTVPLLGLMRAVPAAGWTHRMASPAVGLCVMVLLYQVDCSFNAMINPVYIVAAGGLSCLSIGVIRKRVPAVVPPKDVQWSTQS